MMFFEDRNFPNIGKFIREEMPHFGQRNPKQFKVFIEMFDGDRSIAETAINAGTYPRVMITENIRQDCSLPGMAVASGCFCPVRPNYIYFPARYMRQFETGNETRWNFAGKLLHECVHWGRLKKNLSRRILHGGIDHEAGRVFERKAGFSNSKSNYWNKTPISIDNI